MPKENPVIAFLNKMADLILLNLIFLLCCPSLLYRARKQLSGHLAALVT